MSTFKTNYMTAEIKNNNKLSWTLYLNEEKLHRSQMPHVYHFKSILIVIIIFQGAAGWISNTFTMPPTEWTNSICIFLAKSYPTRIIQFGIGTLFLIDDSLENFSDNFTFSAVVIVSGDVLIFFSVENLCPHPLNPKPIWYAVHAYV